MQLQWLWRLHAFGILRLLASILRLEEIGEVEARSSEGGSQRDMAHGQQSSFRFGVVMGLRDNTPGRLDRIVLVSLLRPSTIHCTIEVLGVPDQTLMCSATTNKID